MDLITYQELAARTLVARPGFQLTERELMIAWNTIGLCGEVGEVVEQVQKAQFVGKELGDVLWYIAALCTKLEVSMAEFQYSVIAPAKDKTQLELAAALTVAASGVAELVKKGIFHRHGLNELLMLKALREVYTCAVQLSWIIEVPIGEIAHENIEKLMKRYPAGFNTADSVKRVDVK